MRSKARAFSFCARHSTASTGSRRPALIVDTEQLALPEATQRLTACVIDKFGDQPARTIAREAS
jgi:hypothetical protein